MSKYFELMTAVYCMRKWCVRVTTCQQATPLIDHTGLKLSHVFINLEKICLIWQATVFVVVMRTLQDQCEAFG